MRTPSWRTDGGRSEEESPFEEIYEQHYRPIFNYILYSVGDLEMAMDLTSETFFKALRAMPRYERRGIPVSAWLYRIASREIAMYYRSSSRSKSISFSHPEQIEVVRGGLEAAEVSRAIDEFERCEDAITLMPALTELASKYREVVFLRFYCDCSFEEISRTLGRPTGTVKAQVHRALKMLRTRMQPRDASLHSTNRDVAGSRTAYAVDEEVD